MPWFPDFVSATELARRQSQIAGRTDPVTQYLQALEMGNARALETIWPGTIVISRHVAALAAGDVEACVQTFTATGYLRGSFGPNASHQGARALDSYYSDCFSAGGGIELECCCVTDDGTRCVVEYNLVRWGRHALAPQAGLAVFERDPDGFLSAVRIYDDVQPPTDAQLSPTTRSMIGEVRPFGAMWCRAGDRPRE